MSSKLLIPLSIVVAGVIISFAVFFGGGNGSPSGASLTNPSHGDSFGNSLSDSAGGIRPVNATDHVRGNPDAPVTIVEFSDFECPFCKRLHPTLEQALGEFPDDVKWVYRHFPLSSIHSRAQAAAVASECIASLGGNSAFWEFSDFVFDNQSRLGDPLYQEFVVNTGLDQNDFNSCVSSSETETLVDQDLQDALASGGRGTPYVVVINENGDLFPFSGALPYSQVRSIIQQAISG